MEERNTFADAWRTYLDDPRTRSMKEASLRRVRSCWNNFVRFLEEEEQHKYIEEVEYESAMAYLDKLAESKATGTVHLHKTALHGIFARIRRSFGLYDNPFSDMPVQRVVRREHRCFTDAELDILFDYLRSDTRLWEWYLVCLIGYYTGMRFADCCCITVDMIDKENNVIHLDERKGERYDKGYLIPVHEDLRTLLYEAQEWALCAGDSLILPTLGERSMRNDSTISKQFNQMLRGLGIKKDAEEDEYIIDFHSFRHTFNTRLAEGNIDIGARMRLTGHSNIRTNQIYNHGTQVLERAINSIPNIDKGSLPLSRLTQKDLGR